MLSKHYYYTLLYFKIHLEFNPLFNPFEINRKLWSEVILTDSLILKIKLDLSLIASLYSLLKEKSILEKA